MLIAIDNTSTVQPLPRADYVDICVVEENPWRKVFHAGTAGTATEYFCAERLVNGAPYQFVKLADKTHVRASSPQSDIETVIALTKPSMSQLAAAFGVSRQRIYDWRSGAGMSSGNAERMSELLTAVRVISDHSATPGHAASRKTGNGKSFWEAVASGVSPMAAATAAIKILERDEMERQALKRSLASRKVSRNKESPLFSSHLSE